jgi:hypothetical protein
MPATSAISPWDVYLDRFPSALPIQEQLRFFLQYAILAPSSKNTQPWRFSVAGNTVSVFADVRRQQPVADKSGRELYISLGCALENLLVAAEQFGYGHEARYFPHPGMRELAATVAFHPGGTSSTHRSGISLQTIRDRRTQHGRYTDLPVSENARLRLLSCCGDLGLRVDLTDDPAVRSRVVELNLHADEMEFADPNFRKELGVWVRQGAFGTPRLLSWLGGLLLPRMNVGRTVAVRNAELLSSSPLVGIISTRADDREMQVRTGQALERLWLHATVQGIALQPMSQALQIPSLRTELAQVIPDSGWVPQQMFRLGYARHSPRQHTPRRSVDEVLLG